MVDLADLNARLHAIEDALEAARSSCSTRSSATPASSISQSPAAFASNVARDRDFRPPNEMMRKIFERFLERPASGAVELAAALGTPLAELVPVRLGSHHMRLLGVLARKQDADWLALVDCDRSE